MGWNADVATRPEMQHNQAMSIDDFSGKVVAQGTWLYEGSVRETIEIVSFDYDFWFALPGDDGRPEWEPYPLNEEGVLYYVRVGAEPLPIEPFKSALEARAWTDAQSWAPIKWAASGNF